MYNQYSMRFDATNFPAAGSEKYDFCQVPGKADAGPALSAEALRSGFAALVAPLACLTGFTVLIGFANLGFALLAGVLRAGFGINPVRNLRLCFCWALPIRLTLLSQRLVRLFAML